MTRTSVCRAADCGQMAAELEASVLRLALATPGVTWVLAAAGGSSVHLPSDCQDWRLQMALGARLQGSYTSDLHLGAVSLRTVLASPLSPAGSVCAQFMTCNGVPVHTSQLHSILDSAFRAARSGGRSTRSASAGNEQSAFVAVVTLPRHTYSLLGPVLDRTLVLHSDSTLPDLVYQAVHEAWGPLLPARAASLVAASAGLRQNQLGAAARPGLLQERTQEQEQSDAAPMPLHPLNRRRPAGPVAAIGRAAAAVKRGRTSGVQQARRATECTGGGLECTSPPLVVCKKARSAPARPREVTDRAVHRSRQALPLDHSSPDRRYAPHTLCSLPALAGTQMRADARYMYSASALRARSTSHLFAGEPWTPKHGAGSSSNSGARMQVCALHEGPAQPPSRA